MKAYCEECFCMDGQHTWNCSFRIVHNSTVTSPHLYQEVGRVPRVGDKQAQVKTLQPRCSSCGGYLLPCTSAPSGIHPEITWD